MSMSDPVGDMLTRMRNAQSAGFDVVEIPHSKLKGEITRILKKEGFVKDFMIEGGARKLIRIYLKYTAKGDPVIRGLRRESKPGIRRYVTASTLPKVMSGLGISVLSTSSGLMTDRDARKKHVGGEFLCSVW